MPTYDYKCLKCGHKFELFQPMTAEPIEHCPECNGKVKRLIGAGAGPIFKGNGFYQTDYKNKPSAAAQKNEAKTVVPKTSEPKPGTTSNNNSEGKK